MREVDGANFELNRMELAGDIVVLDELIDCLVPQ